MTSRPSAAELRRSYRLPDDDDGLLSECKITVFKASGPGGQHRNTSFTAVRLHHEPSGIVVIGRRERSQYRNLRGALVRLRARLTEVLTPPKKRVATKPSSASKQKRLDEKRRRSRAKQARGWRDRED